MRETFEIKELSTDAGPSAKPVLASINGNGCWEIVSHKPDSQGYAKLKRKQKWFLAHRLAYEIFIGQIPDGLLVLHKCDNPPCVNPAHLFLGTNQDNADDRDKKGRHRYIAHSGGENGQAKLNDEQVIEARILVKQFTQKQVAKMLNVSRSTVSDIATKKRWKHL